MALTNLIGLILPFGIALTIGAMAIGLFYRDRTRELRHDLSEDDFISEFRPGPGFDTRSNSTEDRPEEEKCCICLEGMKRYQTLRVLSCVHSFHRKCIDNWLRYESFCPNCRTVVPS